jgi:hypothetical protein
MISEIFGQVNFPLSIGLLSKCQYRAASLFQVSYSFFNFIIMERTIAQNKKTPVNKNCDSCAMNYPKVFQCAGCYSATYCSTICQKKDWKNHKERCLKIRSLKQDQKALHKLHKQLTKVAASHFNIFWCSLYHKFIQDKKEKKWMVIFKSIEDFQNFQTKEDNLEYAHLDRIEDVISRKTKQHSHWEVDAFKSLASKYNQDNEVMIALQHKTGMIFTKIATESPDIHLAREALYENLVVN